MPTNADGSGGNDICEKPRFKAVSSFSLKNLRELIIEHSDRAKNVPELAGRLVYIHKSDNRLFEKLSIVQIFLDWSSFE